MHWCSASQAHLQTRFWLRWPSSCAGRRFGSCVTGSAAVGPVTVLCANFNDWCFLGEHKFYTQWLLIQNKVERQFKAFKGYGSKIVLIRNIREHGYTWLPINLSTPFKIDGISNSNCLSVSIWYRSWRSDTREPQFYGNVISKPQQKYCNMRLVKQLI